ncbi:transglycosylase domain-containing protein [Lapidilactobacillus bayanensis]|uniref:transglycosylase domain-containing protein n=1 Tax=Lapidilactobacillus bayanensis TaxID=2485998 RepID=UPI000F76C2CC|nr:transglycosylase domain-containing protein [Lapidilactobacillus bayanensis]
MNEPQNWWTKFLTALQNFRQKLVHLPQDSTQQSRSSSQSRRQTSHQRQLQTPNDWQFKFNVVMSTIRSLTLFLVALLFVGGGLAFGLLLGYFSGLMSQESVPTYTSMKRQISDVKQSSELYFADNVKLDNVKSDLLRKQVSSSEMSPYLKEAIVATEDSDFYNHNGVVPKSLIRAVLGEVTGASVQTGGSTLTQQLVKMQLLSSETTWKRKATEIMLAMRVNKYFSKDDVLESYLNVATFGRNNAGQNIAGVEEAAQGLFGVSAKNLSLPQAAFIAGLPQSPSIYTPYKQDGSLKKDLSLGLKRKDIVLFRMYRNGNITNKQYQAAKKVNLTTQFQAQGTATKQTVKYGYVYNLLLSRARTILIKQLVRQDNRDLTKVKADSALYKTYYNQADTLLKQKGYRIDSTINKSIYDELQTATSQASYTLGQSYTETAYDNNLKKQVTVTEPVQVGSVVLDNTTGKVLAFVGGRNYDDNQVNHAFDTLRSPGSTMKPLLVYGPAVENKVINTQTQIADFPQNFNGYKPSDFGQTSLNKFVSATTALAHSYNLPTVNLYNYLLNQTSVKPADYLKKMGITLTTKEISELGIALGGTSQGISVQQDASAFATYANNGTHIDPYVISKITAPDGQVVYQHQETKTSVFTPSTTYIMQHLLKEVVKSGTASSLSWRLNFNTDNVWGKTGTTNDNKDIWFVGSTPGITMATWMGYDNFYGNQHSLNTTASSTNLNYWSTMANAIYANQPDLLKLDNSMSKPSGVKSHSVLETTGTKAGKVTVDNKTITLKGNMVTALFNNDDASDAKADFAIGGTDKSYKLFYDNYNGTSNAYGKSVRMDAKGNVLDSNGNIVKDDDDTTSSSSSSSSSNN